MPCPDPTSIHCRAKGLGVAAGLLRTRRTGTGRGGRGCVIPQHCKVRVGRGLGRTFRRRTRGGILPVDAGANPLLRGLLGLGSLGAADAAANQPFNWHDAVWHLRVPVLQALFQQVSSPSQLQPLGLVETLDWTAAALDRVDRAAFFDKFNEGEAVRTFTSPSWKRSIPPCASSSACGTRLLR